MATLTGGILDIRARGWVFTINNYSEAQLIYVRDKLFEAGKLKYLIVGKEVAPTTGTPHLQGYLFRDSDFTGGRVKKLLNPDGIGKFAWFKNADGNADHSKVYCSKDHVLVEKGTRPKGAKNGDKPPNPLHELHEAIKSGTKSTGLWDTHYNPLMRYSSGAQACMAHYANMKLKPVPTILVAWGKTGTGKSRWACDSFGRGHDKAYWVTPGYGRIWYGGYDQQDAIIFDDFVPSNLPIQQFKLLTDRYSFFVEPKGMQVAMTSKYIIFTSNEDPKGWYRNPDIMEEADDHHWQAVQRRLEGGVMEFDGIQPHIPFMPIKIEPIDVDDDDDDDDDMEN